MQDGKDRINRVMTRSEASKRSKLEGGTAGTDLHDGMNTDCDMTTAADDNQLRETIEQLGNIDVIDIDCNEKGCDGHIADTDTTSANMIVVAESETETEDGERPIMTATPELINREDDSPVTDGTVGEQLSVQQQRQLRDLLCNYPDVLSGKPGRTELIEHSVRIKDDITENVMEASLPITDREAHIVVFDTMD